MKNIKDLKIHLYADGANKEEILKLYKLEHIRGFTTNPTLMAKAGIRDYAAFAQEILRTVVNKPISFEVFADEFSDMKRQALQIKAWGSNVFVKIPVTNTRGETSYKLIKELADAGVKLNVTAVFTLEQIRQTAALMSNVSAGIISVFAGRIADTGCDPMPIISEAVKICKKINPRLQVLWASPRELLNIFQADEVGCHILTATPDIFNKFNLIGKGLEEYSRETVQMFYRDACAAGFSI